MLCSLRIIGPTLFDGAVNGTTSAAITEALYESFTEEYANFFLLTQYGTPRIVLADPIQTEGAGASLHICTRQILPQLFHFSMNPLI